MKKIIFNERNNQKRAAIIENEKLVELYIEDPVDKSVVGNIYKGRVVKVVPGMQAAFVDIGLKKNGFLQKEQLVTYKQLDPSQKAKIPLSNLIHEGQELIVQVTKDSFGEKGPRLTTLLEIPGRFVVYMPNDSHIAVSKKLEEDEREDWRNLGSILCNEPEGVLFRTSCHGQAKEVVEHEIKALQKKWTAVLASSSTLKPPKLIYHNASSVKTLTRELLPNQPIEIVIDDGELYRNLKEELSIFPSSSIQVTYHMNKENIFLHYGIEQEIERALNPQIWLENGASLMIDQTEALTVVDVNTSKYTGKYNAKDTAIKTNELAAIEIARQLRLRNIGGIILIDFINMDREKDRDKVKRKLLETLKGDPHFTQVFGFTKLGLLEMTRKKDRKPLSEQLTMICSTCHGTGKVFSNEELCFRIERALWEYQGMDEEAILIETAPAVIEMFKQDGHLKRLEDALGFFIYFLKQQDGQGEQTFQIRHIGSKTEIEIRLSK
ncbi:Rne/Rng family ribonuclease [Bacillus sp. Marseille-P3661]|uniref:Rne/Rng family ribonuclease n=1 Tax=Bacillus sp. Marseille-P3661 TaxID=1936234 RepID=UPI000C85DB23|nr:Rne/Rng family ribonuclease [Bacillus sp. Marseille-P3661]